jgi:hypothetical protein
LRRPSRRRGATPNADQASTQTPDATRTSSHWTSTPNRQFWLAPLDVTISSRSTSFRAQTPRTTNHLQRLLPRPGFCIQFVSPGRSGACGPSGAHHRLTPRCAGSANTPLPPVLALRDSIDFALTRGGRGARCAPLCAPTRPPPPIFAANANSNISSLRSKKGNDGTLRCRFATARCRAPDNAPLRAALHQANRVRRLRRLAGQKQTPASVAAGGTTSALAIRERRVFEGAPGKRPAFHSAVARKLARPCVAP